VNQERQNPFSSSEASGKVSQERGAEKGPTPFSHLSQPVWWGGDGSEFGPSPQEVLVIS
jgi:hypothetical protein